MIRKYEIFVERSHIYTYTMGNIFELSFCELKSKEIVNESDGRRLGRITDLVFSLPSGKVEGIVSPFGKSGLFRSQEIYIPWKYIRMIGEDVILVQIPEECLGAKQTKPSKRNTGRTYVSSLPPEKEEPAPQAATYVQAPPPNEPSEYKPMGGPTVPINKPECDFRCEKCMLFDCPDRWKR